MISRLERLERLADVMIKKERGLLRSFSWAYICGSIWLLLFSTTVFVLLNFVVVMTGCAREDGVKNQSLGLGCSYNGELYFREPIFILVIEMYSSNFTFSHVLRFLVVT